MFLWEKLNYTGLIPRPLLEYEYEPWSGAISSLLDLRRALQHEYEPWSGAISSLLDLRRALLTVSSLGPRRST